MVGLVLRMLKNWKLGAFISLISGISATIYIQHLEIGHEKQALTAARARYAQLELSNRELTAALRRQNAAVAALSQDYAQRKQRVAASAQALAKLTARYRKTERATALLGRDVNGECAQLHSIIGGYAQMVKKEKM